MHPLIELPNRPATRREFLQAGLPAFPPFSWFRRGKVRLCDVEFRVIKKGRSDRRYLLIHGDEETARQTLLDHMRTHAGTAYLVTGSKRNVTVAGGALDPNRMFTRTGAERSYRRLNQQWSGDRLEQALAWLDQRREKLLQTILPVRGALLFALHNNRRGYSIHTELPISEQASTPRLREDAHNFFLCTHQADFDRLCQSPYNAVLQKGTLGEEDGSLSRLCAARGLRYINLEVEAGNLARQTEMLLWAERNLA
jgi:hypothetical protein